MRFGKDLINKPIISITDGQLIGHVKDLYINDNLYWLTGIHTGTEGLINRKKFLIDRTHVTVFGIDAVLVKKANVIVEDKDHEDVESWLRLEDLRGRDVDTPGGTKVGTVGDVIIGGEGHITGFVLGKVYVEGLIAEQGLIPRDGLIDTGDEDGVMTIDLPKVEKLLLDEESSESEDAAEEESDEE